MVVAICTSTFTPEQRRAECVTFQNSFWHRATAPEFTTWSMTIMKVPITLLWLLVVCLSASAKTRLDWDVHDHFVLQHDPKGPASLTECCNALGLELVEQVGELENHWLVRTQKHLAKRDETHPVIDTFNYLRRHALDNLQKRTSRREKSLRVVNSIRMLEKQELRKRVKRELRPRLEKRQQGLEGGPISTFAEKFGIMDPIFTTQWHYVNDQYPLHVMNVTGLWEEGITGKGVISAMVDDGLDYESEDLAENFVRSNIICILCLLSSLQGCTRLI